MNKLVDYKKDEEVFRIGGSYEVYDNAKHRLYTEDIRKSRRKKLKKYTKVIESSIIGVSLITYGCNSIKEGDYEIGIPSLLSGLGVVAYTIKNCYDKGFKPRDVIECFKHYARDRISSV